MQIFIFILLVTTIIYIFTSTALIIISRVGNFCVQLVNSLQTVCTYFQLRGKEKLARDSHKIVNRIKIALIDDRSFFLITLHYNLQ